jgi:hypothetical protein
MIQGMKDLDVITSDAGRKPALLPKFEGLPCIVKKIQGATQIQIALENTEADLQ